MKIVINLLLLLVTLLPIHKLKADWASPVDVSQLATTIAPNDPQVAIDPAGNATAVWAFFDGSVFIIQGAKLPFGATTWIPTNNLTSTGLTTSRPQIAVDASGNAVAVWERVDSGSGFTVIQAATLPFGSNSWIPATQNLSTTVNLSLFPEVAVDPAGNAVAVWQQFNGVSISVRSAILPFGSSTWISTNDPGIGADPVVAIDPFGNAVAAWSHFDGSNDIIQAATLKAHSTTWIPTSDLSATGLDAMNPHIAIDRSGKAIVVWTRGNGVSNVVQGATLAPGSGTWMPTGDISQSTATVGAISSEVAVDPSGNAVIVWDLFDSISNVSLIQARYLSLTGAFGTISNLSDSGFLSESPEVVLDAYGNAVAVWDSDIGGQFVFQGSTLAFGSTTWVRTSDLSEAGFNFMQSEPAISPFGYAVVVLSSTQIAGPDGSIKGTEGTFFGLAPPRNFGGETLLNKFLTQTDRINHLTWSASLDPTVKGYHIYRKGKRIATVSAHGPFVYNDHNRKKHPYTYSIRAFNAAGVESIPLTITLK